MNRLYRNTKNYTFNGIDQTDEVYSLADPNWRDDTMETGIGDIDGSDPSMAGYNKGWQQDPYQQRFYANKHAAKEVIDVSHSAENYANEILSLWAEADGPLQNFFTAFTMNKFDNDMIQQIAECIAKNGYKVYPVLTDRRNRYASNTNKLITSYVNKFKDSLVLSGINSDLGLLMENGYQVEEPELEGLLEYYLSKYPNDLFGQLLNLKLTDKKDTTIKPFNDIQLSDENLNALEDIMNEQDDPIYNGPGMNEEDTDRSDLGVPPNSYEVRLSNRLKKK